MSRRMSCSMTIDAVKDQTKTVTRRHVDTWTGLIAGTRLTLIEKGMGLPKGSKQVVLGEVRVTEVRIEPLNRILTEHLACSREGLPLMSEEAFITFWMDSHGYRGCPSSDVMCRRIEWMYL